MTAFEPFHQQQYLNLETFRKSGIGVKTPVWFVHEGETLFVRTVANSGKVKRIRNNTHVNIAPCKADGALLGEWIPAYAHELKGDETDRKVNLLLDKKYGLCGRHPVGAGRNFRQTRRRFSSNHPHLDHLWAGGADSRHRILPAPHRENRPAIFV